MSDITNPGNGGQGTNVFMLLSVSLCVRLIALKLTGEIRSFRGEWMEFGETAVVRPQHGVQGLLLKN